MVSINLANPVIDQLPVLLHVEFFVVADRRIDRLAHHLLLFRRVELREVGVPEQL